MSIRISMNAMPKQTHYYYYVANCIGKYFILQVMLIKMYYQKIYAKSRSLWYRFYKPSVYTCYIIFENMNFF